jgi:hypothetical protein
VMYSNKTECEYIYYDYIYMPKNGKNKQIKW